MLSAPQPQGAPMIRLPRLLTLNLPWMEMTLGLMALALLTR
jgi:hypothetical protein